jgi:plastocyanin
MTSPFASLAAATLAFASLVTSAAHAAPLAVTVVGIDGQPTPNVVVQVLPDAPVAVHAGAEPVVVAQKDIRFVPAVTAVPVGTVVRFTNMDRFDHHIRSMPGGPLGTIPAAKDFEFRIPGAKGDRVSSMELQLDKPGVIALGCHLHGSMRGHLYVSSTPFVAVTDASGRAVFGDVPDGAATVKVWHPEQLLDQADLRTTLSRAASGTAPLAVTLNFTPKKPRATASPKPTTSY